MKRDQSSVRLKFFLFSLQGDAMELNIQLCEGSRSIFQFRTLTTSTYKKIPHACTTPIADPRFYPFTSQVKG